MKENTNPTFDEWQNKYPNSSVNEYYSWIRKNGVVTQTIKTKEFYFAKVENATEKNDYFALIVGVIACSLGIIGFFTPWLSIPLFNISISGNEINQIATFAEKINQNKDAIENISYAKYIYVLPVNLVLLLLANLIRNSLLTSLFTISLLTLTGLIVNFIFKNIPEVYPMFSYGIYLLFFSVIINIYNLFNIKY